MKKGNVKRGKRVNCPVGFTGTIAEEILGKSPTSQKTSLSQKKGGGGERKEERGGEGGKGETNGLNNRQVAQKGSKRSNFGFTSEQI